MKMNIKIAKDFIRSLDKKDLLYHFDDGAVDTLHYNKSCTLQEAKRIDKVVGCIMDSDLDWGKDGDIYGFALKLIKKKGSNLTTQTRVSLSEDLAEWVMNYSIIEGNNRSSYYVQDQDGYETLTNAGQDKYFDLLHRIDSLIMNCLDVEDQSHELHNCGSQAPK